MSLEGENIVENFLKHFQWLFIIRKCNSRDFLAHHFITIRVRMTYNGTKSRPPTPETAGLQSKSLLLLSEWYSLFRPVSIFSVVKYKNFPDFFSSYTWKEHTAVGMVKFNWQIYNITLDVYPFAGWLLGHVLACKQVYSRKFASLPPSFWVDFRAE